MRLSKYFVIFAMLLIMVLLELPGAYSCGPFKDYAIFNNTMHPDFPLELYAKGELGVLRPEYARSYLFVAYRHMSGIGLSGEEQKAVCDLWKDRLTSSWEIPEGVVVKEWLDARSKVPGAGKEPDIPVYRKPLSDKAAFWEFQNYLSDAFATAAKTLQEHIDKYGAESKEVMEWLHAQDMVFSNDDKTKAIPEELTAGSNAPLIADRAYQIASAYFYAGEYDTAKEKFYQISQDKSSPWNKLSGYLVARALLRKATLTNDPEALKQAETELSKVLNDTNVKELHPAAHRLLNYVRFRLEPVKYSYELLPILLKKDAAPEVFKQSLWDFTMGIDAFISSQQSSTKNYEDIKSNNDVIDWMLTFEDVSNGALDHAIKKWKETSSIPWLVASIVKISNGNPMLPDLFKAAEKIKPGSPAYATVSYHRVRLLLESGKPDDARYLLDKILSAGDSAYPRTAYNMFLQQRLSLVRTFDEFLTYAPRIPACITDNVDGRELPYDLNGNIGNLSYPKNIVLFDEDALTIINHTMPLSMFIDMASDSKLSVNLQREIALAAWTRAIILGNEKAALQLIPIVNKIAPEAEEYFEQYLKAPDSKEREFTAMYLILKLPGLNYNVRANLPRLTPLNQIDNFRDNWWCKEDIKTKKPISSPIFLTEQQKADAEKEFPLLRSVPSAPSLLSQKVTKWAKDHPDDPRVPEALHLAVRSSRYGCADDNTTTFSKAAFQLLHSRYPKNPWTSKTPYWF